jgi:hypothetical protein
MHSAAATTMMFKGGCHRLKLQKVILLSSRQPHWLYISRVTASKRLHPESMACRSSAGWRKDNIRIQCVALRITCKNDDFFDLLKINSFLTFHIAQRIAQTPTRTCINSFLALHPLPTSFNQIIFR